VADSDKNIVITPNIGQTSDPSIVFTGGDNNPVTLTVLDPGTLSFDGSSGQLFSITDSLSGTIFSVNDISGIPSFEVDDDGTIRLAEFAGNVLIGTATDDGSNKLQLTGNAKITGNFETTGNISVTGTVDGRDVAADGTKLDGIEAGATADQTASEILTAIKTVDGSGSGLDADLLDGQQGSYYQPASTALNTSTSFGGDVSGTYNAIVVADDSHNHTRVRTHDDRIIEPSADAAYNMHFGFTSWANNNTSPYADYLHLRSYSDSSGGSDNLVMFKKSGIGMRIWQQTFGSSSAYSSYVDVWTTGNHGSGSGLDADLLDGQHASAFQTVAAPNAPSITSTTVVNETIELVFGQSSTSGVTRYEVWSDGATGSDYSLIAIIPAQDAAASMSVVDTSFDTGGTVAYRVYAVKNGVYSTAATTTKSFTIPSLDVTNMSVVASITNYDIQYDLPETRFLDHIEIYKDAETTLGALSRTGAALVYSGSSDNFTFNVSAADIEKYHQFWVECVSV
jgi:hypothetical protein